MDRYRNAIGEERIREERVANYVNKRKPEKLDYGKYLVKVAKDTRKSSLPIELISMFGTVRTIMKLKFTIL